MTRHAHADGRTADELVERLADTIRANHLRVDDPDQPLTGPEAREVARGVLRRVMNPERFPRLCIERGLLFAVEEGTGPDGADVLHVMAWDGDRWIGVDALPLPRRQGTAGTARG